MGAEAVACRSRPFAASAPGCAPRGWSRRRGLILMGVHRVKRRDGSVVWRVRWREGGRGARARTRTFVRKGDATAFEDELRRRRRLGDLGLLDGCQETLDEYVSATWAQTHAVTLSPNTAAQYAGLYDLHIAPYLGALRLGELTPDGLARWQAERIAAGAGRTSVLKSLTLLGGILQRALESERIARNPARLVRKASRPARREVRPLAPVTVEAMRAVSQPRDAIDLGACVLGAAAAGGARALLGRHPRANDPGRARGVARRGEGHEDACAPHGQAPGGAPRGPAGVAAAVRAPN